MTGWDSQQREIFRTRWTAFYPLPLPSTLIWIWDCSWLGLSQAITPYSVCSQKNDSHRDVGPPGSASPITG